MLFTMAVFIWARITFRKTFRIAIQNVIGIVIWTTCIHMHCKCLPNHDQDLCTASDIPTVQSARYPCAYMASARIFRVHMYARITFQKSFAFTCRRIRLSRWITKYPKHVSKARFETALHSHGLKSGFQIRKGPNHVLKRFSDRDSSPCEHSQCVSMCIGLFCDDAPL